MPQRLRQFAIGHPLAALVAGLVWEVLFYAVLGLFSGHTLGLAIGAAVRALPSSPRFVTRV